MTPSHAVKAGKRYRYYVTHASELRASEASAWRIPAVDAEAAVVARLVEYLQDARQIATLAADATAAASIRAVLEAAALLVEQLATPYARGRSSGAYSGRRSLPTMA